jgi:putative membrane protein
MEEQRDQPSKVDPRILFANERTLLAWIRTGLALTGFGFVVARFGLYLREMESMQRVVSRPPVSVWLGVVMVAAGTLVQIAAVVQHASVIRRLRSGETEFVPTVSWGAVLALALALLGVFVAFYLFAIDAR